MENYLLLHPVISVMERNGRMMINNSNRKNHFLNTTKGFNLLVFIIMFLVLCNCANVKQWQREDLSHPIMLFDENPLEKGLMEHHYERREGSSGGNGSQSGGCGCG